MSDNPDEPREETDWDRPDFCPFCGTALSDGGPGFIDHLEEFPDCRTRFEGWRDRIVEDIGGEWSG